MPGIFAEPPELRVGVEARGLDVANTHPGFRAEEVRKDTLAPGKIDDYHVLILEEETFDEFWRKPGHRRALENFVASHGTLAVVGGDHTVYERLGLRGITGEDQVHTSDGQEIPEKAAVAVYRAPDGGYHTHGAMAADAANFDASYVKRLGKWLKSNPDFQLTGDVGTAEATLDEWPIIKSTSWSYEKEPYGVVSYKLNIRQQSTEASADYDWWNWEMRTGTEPGYHKYYSDWHTSFGFARSDVEYYEKEAGYPDHELVHYNNPPDWVGAEEALEWNVGMVEGLFGAPLTSLLPRGYNTEYTAFTEGSSYSEDIFAEKRSPTEQSQYHFHSQEWLSVYTVRVPDDACSKVKYVNKAEWVKHTSSGDDYYQMWITSWREVCAVY